MVLQDANLTKTPTSILVVDDDEDTRANLEDILRDQGYLTASAEDGPAALSRVRESTYDIVLLDYKLPGIDGASLYREIKLLQPRTVAIMITAFAGSDGVQRALEAGTWKVLKKPIDISSLLPLVREAESGPV